MKIFSNFGSSELVKFDDKDFPWMSVFIKNKIKWKHQIHKTYIKMFINTVTVSNLKKQQV